MIIDRLRFITTEKCQYGNFNLYFGILEHDEVPKWYYVDDQENIFPMVKSTAKKTEAFRISGPRNVGTKMFYFPRIEKLRVDHRASMKVNMVRKIELNWFEEKMVNNINAELKKSGVSKIGYGEPI